MFWAHALNARLSLPCVQRTGGLKAMIAGSSLTPEFARQLDSPSIVHTSPFINGRWQPHDGGTYEVLRFCNM
jgi:hypothetical protein